MTSRAGGRGFATPGGDGDNAVSGGGCVVLWTAQIAGEHVPSGRTVHYRGNDILPAPHSLQIVQGAGDSGYFLFYLDAAGREQADTYHDDVGSAMRQAEFEFGVKAVEWKKAAQAHLA